MKQLNIQKIIEKEIPIVKSMGVQFIEFQDDSCTISVPLNLNHNHKGTAFGGSLYSVCTSACYGLMFSLQINEGLQEFDLVIGEGSIRYQKPVYRDFKVKSILQLSDLAAFKDKLAKNGFAKIHLNAYVSVEGDETHLCEYKATFIMLKKKG